MKFEESIESTPNRENIDSLSGGQSVVERRDLYKKIVAEMENVAVSEKDRDVEGNLLAPNGKKSHLPELEWKMVRTPSFIDFFGDWQNKYDEKKYDYYLKYQELHQSEGYRKERYKYKEDKRDESLQVIDELNSKEDAHSNNLRELHLNAIKKQEASYYENTLKRSKHTSNIHADLVASGFSIHHDDFDYSKVLDENGEPLLLYRGTDFAPNNNGKFAIPKKNLEGKDYEVGVFFGSENEARHHHEAAKNESRESKLYKAFVNGRNFMVLDSKPNYWSDPNDSKAWQEKYDGLWVKKNRSEGIRTDHGVNLFDYVAFNPDDVLIVGIE